MSLPGTRRGGRAAEGPALEKRYPVNHGIVGSNPTLSAINCGLIGIEHANDRIVKRIPYGVRCNYSESCRQKSGEMSELAEGARLEIVCAVTSGTEGSNPSLSATIDTNFMEMLQNR